MIENKIWTDEEISRRVIDTPFGKGKDLISKIGKERYFEFAREAKPLKKNDFTPCYDGYLCTT